MSRPDKYSDQGPTIFDTMKREAEARCEMILEKGREEAARIVAEARSAAEEARNQALDEERERAEAQREDTRQRARSEAERANMTMRERVVDRVLDAVHEELRRVAQGPDFPDILCRLLADTMDEAPENAVVLAPPAHVDACRNWLQANGYAGVPVESSERLWDGIAVTNKQRTFRLTNTLTSRFEKSHDAARKAALRRLFGEKA